MCVRCDGRGWENHRYTEFTGRKTRRGVRVVRYSRGTLIATGVGGSGETMTYAQFLENVHV